MDFVISDQKIYSEKRRFAPRCRKYTRCDGTTEASGGWAYSLEKYFTPEDRTAFVWEAEDTAAYTTECDYLRDILLHSGVPESAIIREDRATFTYENAIYSRKRVEKLGLSVKKAIVCCQAFHARRCLLYYQEQFPKTEIFVCPVVTRGISRETWHRSEQGIDTVLGEVQRCGSQFHEILRSHMRQNENSMCKNDRRAADDTLRRE